MNKALKTVLITLLVIVLVLALIGFSIIAFVSWVWGGNRFSPEDAMEAVSLGSSQRERIEVEGCYFYYTTLADDYETSADSNMADCIQHVTPVTKNNIGMWHAVTRPSSYPVYIEGTENYVGSFVVEELDGVYHNFFIPSVGGTNPPTLPDILADGYSVITVDGEDIELFNHSYFTTETEVVKFEINGTKLVVGN